MPIPEEYSRRRTTDELLCLTPEAVKEFGPQPLQELSSALGAVRAADARRRSASLPPDERGRRLREDWARLLGDVEPEAEPKVIAQERQQVTNTTVERIALEVERGIVVPLVLLLPPRRADTRTPVVLGLAQDGKQAFLKNRSAASPSCSTGGRPYAWPTSAEPGRPARSTTPGCTPGRAPPSPRAKDSSARPFSAPGYGTSARCCATSGAVRTSTRAG